jgi:hypothetical protein
MLFMRLLQLGPNLPVELILGLFLLQVSGLIVKNHSALHQHGSMLHQDQPSFKNFSHAMNVYWDSSTSQVYFYSGLKRPIHS